MTLISAVAGRALGYGPATNRSVEVIRGVQIPMRDGVALRGDVYRPAGMDRGPVLLVRSPYGRDSVGGLLWGRLYAERGFQALIQSVRGTLDSGGEFRAASQEHDDGVDTLQWLRAQPWCDGKVATLGPSYLGYAQWALGPDAANTVQAMLLQVTSGTMPFFQGGTVAIESLVSWTHGMAHLTQGPVSAKVQARLNRQAVLGRVPQPVKDAIMHSPAVEADKIMTGREFWHWRNWLQHLRPDDPWWQQEGGDWQSQAGRYTVPMCFVAGWHDVFVSTQLADYRALRAAGQDPYLTVGPWTHTAPGSIRVAAAESLAWFRAHLHGDRSGLRANPVRLFVTGAKEWREYAEWPPPSTAQRWHVHPGGGFSQELPARSEPDRYDYDPASPTPSVGGNYLGKGAGRRKNNELESRPDVLTFTSTPLSGDLEVIGEVRADIFVTSSTPHTDFFVRLCDVDGRGRSVNICDGIRRVYPEDDVRGADGVWCLTIDLNPIAHRFRRGHRLRLQVSSGAFPRFARNLGTGDGILYGDSMVVAHQQVFHDPDRPTSLVLPVRS